MGTFDQQSFDEFVVHNKVYGFFDKPITLKSGRLSHFYANWRTIVGDVRLTEILVDYVLSFVKDRSIEVDTFYGVPEGATKLGVLTQYTFARQQAGYDIGSHALSMGRAKPKEHGAPRDRLFVGAPRGKVVVIEDVTTTGGSSMAVLEFLRDAGVTVSALISLTNRMEKRDDGMAVKEAVEQTGVPFYNMSSALDILPRVYGVNNPPRTVGEAIEVEFATHGVEPLKLV